jgi:hypothetical protein
MVEIGSKMKMAASPIGDATACKHAQLSCPNSNWHANQEHDVKDQSNQYV